MRSLRFLFLLTSLPALAQDDDQVYQPFEGDGFDTWEENGPAFGKGPTAGGQGALAGQINGYAQESFAASYAQGDGGIGTLTSPEFTIERPYISFLVGGGSAKAVTAIQLLVEQRVVMEEVGQDDLLLRPRAWDVSGMKGTKAQIRLIDNSTEEWGFIMADHIVFTDNPNTSFPTATKDGQPFSPGLVSTDAIAGMTIPAGSSAGVFATFEDHEVYSPTALCIDEQGRLLVTETHRFRYGIPDNRHHRYWLIDDIASTTVEDRLAMHLKWDERYPVEAMTERSEKIRLLVDDDGDGRADQSNVFANGFNDPLDGTAAGIFSYRGDVFFACIPHIWKLRDTDGDGAADQREKLVSGFGVRVSLSGHDLNGFVLGPDGRLYGTIGDRAMNVTTREGHKLPYTDQGAVFRFDPDGSNFEVIHAGLRNPKEVAFDQFGNCISVDNNSDQGDKARVVYVMDGADSGWRTDHQNLHTFHREVGYEDRPINQWMQERQWDKHHDGQPAFLLPPIDTLTSGPSGLAYQPGTGFSNNCADSFLICDYKGGAAASGIWAFGIEPAGAGMKMTDPRKFNWGAAVTDLEFGYDGRLYVTDFIDGWESHAAGRVYTLSSPESLADETTKEVAAMIREGFKQRTARDLYELMAHPDQRVRLRAQIALSERPEAVPFFINATEQTEQRLQRLHGVWGLWIRARRNQSAASTDQLLKLLGDPDEEVRAQAARALGEAPLQDRGRLVNSLHDASPRVRACAALSLTRLRANEAFNPALVLLAENADRDPYLRHAGVMALLGSGTEEQIADLHSNPHKSIRMAAVMALRRLHSPALVKFFFDQEHPEIADEAIRAVHDVPIEAARPAVAALLDEYAPGQDGRPLTRMMLRRLLHSAFRVGGPENAARLARVAANETLDRNERLEALRLLAVWTDPPEANQSLGRYAPLPQRPLGEVKSTLESEIAPLLAMDGDILAAAIGLVTQYNLAIDSLDAAGLAQLLANESLGANARGRALELLVKRNPENLDEALANFASDQDAALASRALELLATRNPERALGPLKEAVAAEDVQRAQRAWAALGELPGSGAAETIEQGVRELIAGTTKPAVALEVFEAAGKREEEAVQKALQQYQESLPADDPLAAFRVTLAGGDAKRGDAIFHTHPAAQCFRCHRVEQGHAEGAEAGPNLAGIGKRHDAEYLLESLIVPNATVAPGYGVVSLALKNGDTKGGILTAESDDTIDLLEGETVWRIQKADIKERSKPVSAMAPPMGAVLSKREIRDLMAWLTSLTEGAPSAPPEREVKMLEVPVVAQNDPAPAPDPEPPTEPAPAPAPEPMPEPAPAAEASASDANDEAVTATIDPAVMEMGRKNYLVCTACHGPDGKGMPGIGPPLANSEWVEGPVENLIRIQMRGLEGDIEVAGRKYILGVDFPVGMLQLSYQTDEQMAAVLTYIRNSFGNEARPVKPEEVAALRSEVGKPPIKVSELIPPTRAEPAPSEPQPAPTASAEETPPDAEAAQTASEDSAASSSNRATAPPPASGIEMKTVLLVGGIILWCGICCIPILRRFAGRREGSAG